MRVTRRQALSFGSAALLTSPVRGAVGEYALYIPGYRAAEANIDGVPATEHPIAARNLPKGYDGPTTLVTRIGLASRRIDHAVFPVQGHVVALDRRAGTALLHAQSRDWSVSFDPETLDMGSISLAFASGFTGGGHAQLIDGGKTALTVERAPYGPYLGAPEAHYGRVTLRDAATLKTIESISTFGISPHDLHVLDDRRTLAIANYGSLAPRDCTGGPPDHTIEPSVTFVDLMSGKLEDKVVLPAGGAELRHLAAADRSRLMAIQVDQGSHADLVRSLGTSAPKDLTERNGCAYLPAPMLSLRPGQPQIPPALIEATTPALQRHGLSIAHDPLHGVYIATYPSSHTVLVISDTSGEVIRTLDTAALGLPYPSGLALHPDEDRYYVAGAVGPVMAFSRTTHERQTTDGIDIPLHRHSHIVIG